MNDMALISIVSLVGWLLLVGSSLASFKLGWSKMVQMALIWLVIFGGAFVAVSFFMGS